MAVVDKKCAGGHRGGGPARRSDGRRLSAWPVWPAPAGMTCGVFP